MVTAAPELEVKDTPRVAAKTIDPAEPSAAAAAVDEVLEPGVPEAMDDQDPPAPTEDDVFDDDYEDDGNWEEEDYEG